MQISPQGIALIKRFEGFSATPYYCPAGKRTIGYGHVISAGEDCPAEVTSDQAETLLRQDAAGAEWAVNAHVSVPLAQNQFDALVCLAYNIGAAAFAGSTLLALLNAGKPDEAAAQFSHWVYANGRKLDGLAARRAAEAALFLGISNEKSG